MIPTPISTPYLTHISVFPVKSMDGLTLSQVTVLASGALKHDREFALFDHQGRWVNGKRDRRIQLLRSTFAPDLTQITLRVQDTDSQVTLPLGEAAPALETWLSEYFGFAVQVKQNCHTGFPDDPVASGPTVISTATLETVASWFPGLSVAEVRDRFRANLEIGGVPPFWEDQFFAEPEQRVRFQIGEVVLEGVNPCQRCIVPSRDTKTAIPTQNFQKVFVNKRQQTLPDGVITTWFNHYYRLSVNTLVPSTEAGKTLCLGDPVKILGLV